MKANSFLVVVLVCFSVLNSQAQGKHTDYKYSLAIDRITALQRGDQTLLQIFVRLQNNTNDTLTYWELNCQTKYFLYQMDSKLLTWGDMGTCLSTMPGPFMLAPHVSRYDTLWAKRILSNKQKISFKLRCHIVKTDKDYFHFLETGEEKNADILWSKEIIWDGQHSYVSK